MGPTSPNSVYTSRLNFNAHNPQPRPRRGSSEAGGDALGRNGPVCRHSHLTGGFNAGVREQRSDVPTGLHCAADAKLDVRSVPVQRDPLDLHQTSTTCSPRWLSPAVKSRSRSIVMKARMWLASCSTIPVRTRRVRYSEMALINVYPADQMQAGFANFKYQVIVGIPSVEFQSHMIHLRCFGVTVYARITDTEVRLSAANEEVFLTNENCIIGGDVSEEDPVTAVFSLHCLSAIMNASRLTSRVWLLHSNSSLPFCMLNFPVGALGNLMFHFPSPEDGDET
ncbi:proliferating cell nuclear antigen-like [Prunus yedoensis var. nudiflora]|uniref:Proliferating cell nuclear antigen-like n=1 Tax=Prunus yedoensis var. nudiflora TaxID=2094558 RepID=A0A314Z9D0_PRUYE|nr:proliferating cell nuclear antigen-like [Prunus yedoensis var. nudiflora]